MKKLQLLLMSIIIILIFSSCSTNRDRSLLHEDNEAIADATFDKIITAVNAKDASKVMDVFSYEVQNNGNLEEDSSGFIEFIQGDIISYSCASEAGVGADHKTEKGKSRKEIQSSFCLKTTESMYYIAIRECVKDEFDSNNVGVLSIYIIEAKDWSGDYVYRGDGNWTCGINIVANV